MPGGLRHRLGVRGLLSAALGAGMVLFFYVVGQFVMVHFADAGARTLLVGLDGQLHRPGGGARAAVLLAYGKNRDSWPALSRWPSS